MRLIILLLFAITPAIAAAVPCDQISDNTKRLACYEKMSSCLDIKDNDAKLACLDKEMKDAKSSATSEAPLAATASVPPAVGETAIPPHPKPKNSDVDANFGLHKRQVGQMTSTIVKVERRFDGVDFITLANQQVWRATLDRAHQFKVGQEITIKPGIFDSFTLTSKPWRERMFKVRRVR